jgi:hypothetical protein
VPLAWSWRLSEATPAQRANWRIIGDGYGVHWPDVDEDISADGMLNGVPARRPRGTVRSCSVPTDKPLHPPSRARRKAQSQPRRRAARG